MGVFVTFIFVIWEKINPFMCFLHKCPDFLLLLSGILVPRIPPFRRSGLKCHMEMYKKMEERKQAEDHVETVDEERMELFSTVTFVLLNLLAN